MWGVAVQFFVSVSLKYHLVPDRLLTHGSQGKVFVKVYLKLICSEMVELTFTWSYGLEGWLLVSEHNDPVGCSGK